MKKKLVAAVALGLCSSWATATEFSYQFLEIGLSQVKIDDDGYTDSAIALDLGISHELGSNFYLSAGYQTLDIGGITRDGQVLALGGHLALGQATDAYVEVGAVKANADFRDYSSSNSGSEVTLGLRQKIGSAVELGAGIQHTSGLGSNDNSYFVEGLYEAKANLQLGLDFGFGDNTTSYGLKLRVNY